MFPGPAWELVVSTNCFSLSIMFLNRRVLIVLAFSLAPTFALAEKFDFHHENVLGTSFHLQVDANSQLAANIAETEALAEIDRLAAILSSYDSRSELSKFLSLPVGSSMVMSSELFEVLNLCEQWTTASGGAFNPAVESLSLMWKQAGVSNQLIDASALHSLTSQIAAKHWKLDVLLQQATRQSTLPLSLNAIAKGYILDRVAESTIQRSKAVNGVLLDIGGDIRVAGNLTASISIADPNHDAISANATISSLMIENAGIATSGRSERTFQIQGTKYSHLIDPRTGSPVTEIISATVIAPTAQAADVLATICSVMSTDDSLKLINSINNTECMLITAAGVVHQSPNWPTEQNHNVARLSNSTILVNSESQEAEPQMLIEFEITKAENAGRYRRPYVAVWIEDKDGFPVRTLSLFMMQDQPGPRWYRDLRRWYAGDQMRLLVDKMDIIDAVSKPTRNPGQYKVAWDGRDDAGSILKEGEYTLLIEAAREHGSYQLMKHKFQVGGKPFEESLKGNAEISSATVKYKATAN